MPGPHEPAVPLYALRRGHDVDKAERGWKVGDRIELVEMPNDPAPIPAGARGTIERIVDIGDIVQIGVAWDNGRSLHVVIPPDRIRRWVQP